MYDEMDPTALARDDELAEDDATQAFLDRLTDQAPPLVAPLLALDRMAAHIARSRGVPEVGSW